ncbi:Unknown protein sequence, partial [Pseudomonas savastanoi pv. retacarpa]
DLEGIGDGLMRKGFTRFKPPINDGFAKRHFNCLPGQRYRPCNAEGYGFKHVLRVQFLRFAVTHLQLLFTHANTTLRRRIGIGAAQGCGLLIPVERRRRIRSIIEIGR